MLRILWYNDKVFRKLSIQLQVPSLIVGRNRIEPDKRGFTRWAKEKPFFAYWEFLSSFPYVVSGAHGPVRKHRKARSSGAPNAEHTFLQRKEPRLSNGCEESPGKQEGKPLFAFKTLDSYPSKSNPRGGRGRIICPDVLSTCTRMKRILPSSILSPQYFLPKPRMDS